ncbi:MAG: hypothetical protein NUV49_03075 [Patescibacteria group bacterium]|nr:hypothetical protein [Patescibacteria group bacterium]
MKNIILIIVGAIVVAGGSYYALAQKQKPDLNKQSPQDQTSTQSEDKGSKPAQATAPALSKDICALQVNGAYICPANAISDFGPYAILNSGTERTCTISYDSTNGFSFKGAVKTGNIPAGDLAVAVTPSGAIANVARSARQSISFHAGEDGQIDHVLFVDSDYTSDQCLTVR